MQLIRGLHNLKPAEQGTVLTIGNFDGVHRGHQAILERLKECAYQHDIPASVMIFEPHPEELFRGEQAPARLSRCRDKLDFLKSAGVDQVILVRFNYQFAAMTADEFLQDLLVNSLGVRYLIVGDDFHFGHKRQGNFEFLKQHSDQLGFGLEQTPTLSEEDQRVSSTLIRNALAENDLSLAEKLMGRPFKISGRVSHGNKRGRSIGFPTANILLHRKTSPVNGVYAVTVQIAGQEATIKGVANVGTRPTVDGSSLQLEVHLFDWQQDIYGQLIEVEFDKFIRSEQRFADFEALKSQIEQDVDTAKQYFND